MFDAPNCFLNTFMCYVESKKATKKIYNTRKKHRINTQYRTNISNIVYFAGIKATKQKMYV